MKFILCLFFALMIVLCYSEVNVKSVKNAKNDEKVIGQKNIDEDLKSGKATVKTTSGKMNDREPDDVMKKNGNSQREKRSTTKPDQQETPRSNTVKTERDERTNNDEPNSATSDFDAKKNTKPKENPSTVKPKSTKKDNVQEKYDKLENANSSPNKDDNIKNILAVFPYQGRSHHMFFQPVLRMLLEEGHNITTFTSLPLEDDFKNHNQIIIKPTLNSWAELFEFDYQTSQASWELRSDLDKLAESFLFPLYESDEFRDLVNGNYHFDMVLLEPFFMQEPLVFLGKRFQCPVVALATGAPESVQDYYLGRPRNPALEPEWTTCVKQSTMSFFQRTANTFSWLVNALEHRFYYLPKRERDMKRLLPYFGLDTLPSMSQMLRDISLTLGNAHQLVHEVTPVSPNLILTPGLHIKENASLPKDLQTLMDGAENGVVYFTMGSMIPVSKMKQEREILTEVFSKLPQLVLWKSDVELPNLTSNVKTYKWFPQQAVLAHPNLKLFITHGGMLSKQEAVYNGVPLVSIPLFGDQPMNTGHSQATGLGITVPFRNMTVDNLYSAITTVITDIQYKKRLEKNSKIFKEAVSRSKSSALYWMNHVMKYDGADYLRKNHELEWYQFYLLDVIAAFLLIIISSVSILMKCAQGLCSLRFPKKPQQTKIKKQ